MISESGTTPELLATSEAADVLGVSISTLHRWRVQGILRPAHKVSTSTGVYLFAASDVYDLRSAGRAGRRMRTAARSSAAPPELPGRTIDHDGGAA
jgi:predicted site-specific integrase-resolvase